MKKIAVLCSTDYNTYPVGGMMSFIKDAASEMTKHFEVDFWGIDAGAGVNSFTSGGRVFPVHFFGSVKTGRKIVPNMVRVVWHLWRNRNELLSGGYDAIYIHGIPLNLALPVRVNGMKRINHVHGLNNPFSNFEGSTLTRMLLFYIYECIRRRALRDSDLVFLAADSKGVEPFKLRYQTTAKILPIPNFCDTATFGIDAQPIDRVAVNLSSDDRILLYVGRMSPEKDPILALKILDALKASGLLTQRIRLVMIGSGVLKREVEAAANRLGVEDDVRLLGLKPRTEVARWMQEADILLLTSYFEGFPVVLAEAAECGLPIICTEITGVHDLVINGRNGYVVPSRAPKDFVAPILDTLVNRAIYGIHSHELAAQYKPERILERLCRDISSVL